MNLRGITLRVYTDTSVIGGCFDREFNTDSIRLMELARVGHVKLLLSALVIDELTQAPPAVQNVINALPESSMERIAITNEMLKLRDAYLKAGIVGLKSRDDATHVAIATVVKADAIVSWNFKHIVHLGKIRGYNIVNRGEGYSDLVIITPTMVMHERQTK